MAKISLEVVEKYQKILERDPDSKIFAALADAYREHRMYREAELTAQRGIDRHPEYVAGYVALGRLYCEAKRFQEALEPLNKAARLAPDNLLAYQLLGQAFLELKKPKESLKAHKMALFLNPQSERSQKAVAKLEAFSAEDYEADLFAMKKLPEFAPSPSEKNESTVSPFQRDRDLSLLDALLLRQDFAKAQTHFEELLIKYPDDDAVLKKKAYFDSFRPEAPVLRPQVERAERIRKNQIQALERVLKALQKRSLESIQSL